MVVLEKTLESPLDCKETKPVQPVGNQPWIFIWRIDAEGETPLLWPPDVKNWLIGKDPDAGKDWRQEEKGTAEDEMVGWHQWLDGHEFEQVSGVGDGQGSLVCCSPWGCQELDMTEQLNWTEWMTIGKVKPYSKYPSSLVFLYFPIMPVSLQKVTKWELYAKWCKLERHTLDKKRVSWSFSECCWETYGVSSKKLLTGDTHSESSASLHLKRWWTRALTGQMC